MVHIFRQYILPHAIKNIITAVATQAIIEHFDFAARSLFYSCGPGIPGAKGKALHEAIAITSNIFHIMHPKIFIHNNYSKSSSIKQEESFIS